jgi:hypothetical protein
LIERLAFGTVDEALIFNTASGLKYLDVLQPALGRKASH